MTATEAQTAIHADTPRLLRSTRKSLEINARVLGKCRGRSRESFSDDGRMRFFLNEFFMDSVYRHSPEVCDDRIQFRTVYD